ncbi:MAG: Flp pilus assembly complex ATPase component TadA [Moritella sp.]|uniref:GspE/PulE family protein n=1 Tax=Moritella sp. TaxID=78556 RepID=UPI001DFD5ACC|nr:ATPase, T2SS/T4P/T4SS family [Moritella sp.]NQZ49376.1 Flp pilus assembly complex ATPase component TadA [Moritella sp.]
MMNNTILTETLFNAEQLQQKTPNIQLIKSIVEFSTRGFNFVHYKDGTFVVSKVEYCEKPEEFYKLKVILDSVGAIISNFGFSDIDTIAGEINRAKKIDSESSLEDLDESEAQKHAADIISYAIKNNCSDIHLYLRNPQTEVRYNRYGKAVRAGTGGQSYEALKSMVARLFNWAGANNSSDDFNEMSIQNTSLTMMIKLDSNLVPTRLRIEKSPLETKGDMKIVIRVSPAVQSKNLKKMNISPEIEKLFSEMMKKPSGMVIVSGPTGSGKTTLLHAMMHEIPKASFCSTIEDPVELLANYNPLISQHNLIPDLSYNKQLRSLLRQDPNVIAIGEMRDEETARSSIRASLTGHLIITTIHTHNSLGIPSRLNDMGVKYTELAMPDVLSLLIAIRLTPTLCSNCSTPLSSHKEMLDLIKTRPLAKTDTIRIKSDRGCSSCVGGITGIETLIEFVVINDEFRAFLRLGDMDGAKKLLKTRGWKSLQDLAWEKINRGHLDPQDAEMMIKDILIDSTEIFDYSNCYQK